VSRRESKDLAMSVRTDKPLARRGIPPSPSRQGEGPAVVPINSADALQSSKTYLTDYCEKKPILFMPIDLPAHVIAKGFSDWVGFL
jgi:hypothetical protein